MALRKAQEKKEWEELEKSEAGDRGRLLVDLTLVPTLSEYKENIKTFDAAQLEECFIHIYDTI